MHRVRPSRGQSLSELFVDSRKSRRSACSSRRRWRVHSQSVASHRASQRKDITRTDLRMREFTFISPPSRARSEETASSTPILDAAQGMSSERASVRALSSSSPYSSSSSPVTPLTPSPLHPLLSLPALSAGADLQPGHVIRLSFLYPGGGVTWCLGSRWIAG